MSSSTAGKVVVVTGANEGIGYHLARELLANGYRVAAFDVADDGARRLVEASPDRARFYACDVTSDEAVEGAVAAVLDEWGHIDVLVNNAAVLEFAPFTDTSLESARREMEINYFGTLRLVRAVLPGMLERDDGIVHVVGSGVGQTGHAGLSGYAGSKGALEAFVRTLRSELRHTGVAVTLLYPPATRTRSASVLGYPDVVTKEPAEVGRKLAAKVETRGPSVYADASIKYGMALTRLVPGLAWRGTARFVDEAPRMQATDGEAERAPVE